MEAIKVIFIFYSCNVLYIFRRRIIVFWLTNQDATRKGLSTMRGRRGEFNFNGKVIEVI